MSGAARLSETPSGLRVVSEAVPGVRSVALGMWVRTGSRDEVPSEAGISHFLEHLLFKGTPTYSAVEISEVLDGLGAAYNAFTGKEVTSLHARFMDSHLDQAFGLLGEMLLESTFPEIDSERQVVIEEIAMYEDDPASRVHDHLSESLFGEQPLGRRIIGSSEVISSVPVDEIRSYHDRRYNSANLVIAAAGNVDHEHLLDLAGKMEPNPGQALQTEPERALDGGEVVFQEKETEQYHVCFGTIGINRSDDRRYAMAVLDCILGGSSSSRLFREIREERGLAYSVGTYVEQYEDTGVFAIHAGTRPENLREVSEIAATEVQRILEEPVPEDEVLRARENVKGRLVLGEESTGVRMHRIGRAVLHRIPILSLDEMLAKVDSVTPSDISDLATEIFGSRTLSAAGVGRSESEFREGISPVTGVEV